MLAFRVDASLTFTNPCARRRARGGRADGARPDPHGARGPGAPQKAQINRRGARRAPCEKKEIGLREAGPPRARGATTLITKL